MFKYKIPIKEETGIRIFQFQFCLSDKLLQTTSWVNVWTNAYVPDIFVPEVSWTHKISLQAQPSQETRLEYNLISCELSHINCKLILDQSKFIWLQQHVCVYNHCCQERQHSNNEC